MNTTKAVCRCAVIVSLPFVGLLGGVAQAKEKEELHQTFPLTADGTVKVDNVNGKIHVTAWDRPEVKIDAVKTARNKEELDATKIEIDAKPDSVRIHTQHPDSGFHWKLWRKSKTATVDYEIKVPINTRLDDIQNVNGSVEVQGVRGRVVASTVNGHLEAKGLAADAKLEAVNGAVEASFDKLDGSGSVSVKSVNGHVELTLPSNANADVSGSTVNGGIHTDSGLTVKKNWPVGSELHGTLGKGGAQVKTETVNGGIRVKLVASKQAAEAEVK